jgi:hypothetical protein
MSSDHNERRPRCERLVEKDHVANPGAGRAEVERLSGELQRRLVCASSACPNDGHKRGESTNEQDPAHSFTSYPPLAAEAEIMDSLIDLCNGRGRKSD